MHDTPLGQVVELRSEHDPEVIRSFTPGQKAIRSEWQAFMSGHVTAEETARQMAGMEAMFARVFGGGEEV